MRKLLRKPKTSFFYTPFIYQLYIIREIPIFIRVNATIDEINAKTNKSEISGNVRLLLTTSVGTYKTHCTFISVKIHGLMSAPLAIIIPSTPDFSLFA